LWLLAVDGGGRCAQVLSRGGRNTTEGSNQVHSNHRARLSVHTAATAATLLGEQLGAGLSVVHATALSTTTAAVVSHSCACIGSPCLRRCVHGASIGGGGGARAGEAEADELFAEIHRQAMATVSAFLAWTRSLSC
jgi:hypothetical protein